MLKRLAFFFALSPLSAFAQVQFDIVSVPVCWNDSSLIKYTYVTTSGAYLDLGYFSPSGAPVTVSGGTLKTGFCFGQTLSIDSTANRTFTITLGDQTVSWVDSVGAGSGGGITALRLGELTDVDTTGEATGSIILYDATSGKWEAQANSINNLIDGYTNGDKILQIGTDGTPVYGDSGYGDNDTTAIVIGNIADNGTVKNRVVAIGLTNNPSTGMLIDNSIVIGKNAGYVNGKDTIEGQPGGYLNVLIGDYAGFRGTRGSQITYLGQFSGQFAGGGNNTGVGYEALKGDNSAASLFTYNNTYQLYNSSDNAGLGSFAGWLNGIGGKNTYLGAYAGAGNQNGWQSLFAGHSAGRYAFASGTITAKNITNGVYLGVNSRAGDSTAVNEIVIGAGAIGNGSNTATLGNNSITATYLKGTTNLRGYGAGNKEAADLGKTASGYLAGLATDGTIIEVTPTPGVTTLGGLTDVTISSPQINDILIYNGTAWVNDTLSVSGGGVLSVTANNGLSNTGTATQPVISLGGTLTAATTTINANLKNLVINRPFNFEVDSVYLARIGTQDGLSTSSELRIGAAANTWQSVNNNDGLTNQVRLYSSTATQGAEISSYQNANNSVFTQIELLPQEMQIVTPNVNTLTATAGQVLKLVNATTGEVEFAADATGSNTLSGLTDVSIGTPAAGEVLIYNGTAWVNDTVINTLTATNGVRNAGSSASPEIRLGGSLLENTTITGAGTYSITIDNPSGFSAVNADLFELEAESATRRNRVAASQFSTVFMESRSLTGTEAGGVISASPDRIRLIHSNNTNTFTHIDIDTNAISLVTPNVRTNTATAGQVLKLVNATTGEVEFATDATGGGGFTLPTDSITFNDNTGDAVAQKLQYNSEYGTLIFGAGNNLPVHIGSDLGWYVKNQTGSNIGKGVPVYASGTDGASGRITIAPMVANNSIPAKFFLGVTAEPIDNGADGFVWSQGKIRQIDLSGFSAGAVLYVSPTSAGTFTATEPAAPNLKLPVGFVVNNTATGTLAVRATTGNYLAEAHDVQINSASNGQVLKYDGTKWVNGTDLVNDADADPANELQDLTLTGNTLSLSGDATTVDLSGYLDDQTVSLTGGGITAISGTYPNFTITSTEVDGSTSNEGSLSIGTGVAGSSVFIQSNTSGSTPVTISVGDGLDIVASGSTIFLNPEAYAIQSGTSGAISWGSAPQRIHVLDFGANTSITLSFTNVAVGGIYTLRVTGNSGTDTLIWPASAKLEDGTSAGTVTLQNGGQMFTFYWDGTNYWVK